jgi:hypothetical protein
MDSAKAADYTDAVSTSVRPHRGWRIVAGAATFVAFAALVWVAAYWFWIAIGPAPTHIAPAAPADPAATVLAADLFRGSTAVAPTSSAEPAQSLAGDTRLLGVLARRNGDGYALFRLANGPKLVARGQEIVSGVTLTAVRPDGITIRDSGRDRDIGLRSSPVAPTKTAPAPRAAADAATKVASRSTACTPPAGFKGQTVTLNAELLGGLIATPDSWRALIVSENGALVVRDASGFAAMLGLQTGDRIEQANGIALTVPDDVTGAVLRPLQANQSVRLTGTRGGQPRELWLVNIGACAA